MRTASLATAAAVVFATAAPATADPTGYDVGVRVGGYGFHREGDGRPGEGWTECRMDGLGIFASRGLGRIVFVEAGVDVYTSADTVLSSPQTDLPIDRTSGLFSVAVGARSHLASWLRGYVQLGAGVELTRASVAYGDMRLRDAQLLPEAFFGVGLDLRIARATYVGASLRTLAMGNFAYDPARLDPANGWVAPPPTAEVFDASLDVAAQGQFYVRREL